MRLLSLDVGMLHNLAQLQTTDFHWRISGGIQAISPATTLLGVNLPTPRKNRIYTRTCLNTPN